MLMLVHAGNIRILMFPTKQHWRDPSRIEWIDAGLAKFVRTYKSRGIQSAAFPLLGCGCGGLDRDEVLALMRCYLDPLPIPVEIYI